MELRPYPLPKLYDHLRQRLDPAEPTVVLVEFGSMHELRWRVGMAIGATLRENPDFIRLELALPPFEYISSTPKEPIRVSRVKTLSFSEQPRSLVVGEGNVRDHIWPNTREPSRLHRAQLVTEELDAMLHEVLRAN